MIPLGTIIMKHQGLESINPDVLENLGASVGLENFYAAALSCLGGLVDHDMHWAITYACDHRPIVHLHKVIADSESGINRTLIRDVYEAGYYRFDPFYRYWQANVKPGVARMNDIVEDKTDNDYIENFMPITGVEDDVVLFCQISTETAIGLCLERRKPFSSSELKKLDKVFPLFNGLAHSHSRIAGIDKSENSQGGLAPINFGEAFSEFLPGELTPRERQIVRLVLVGFDNASISRRLGVSVGTIKNHRKRIHAKIDITSERELFSLFLSYLTKIDPSELASMGYTD